MEVEVKEALRTLTEGNTRLDPNQVLGLQDRLRLVDEKFSLLRREVTRLNSALADEKDKNDILKVKLDVLSKENSELKEASKKKPKKTKTTAKKKTTTKKK